MTLKSDAKFKEKLICRFKSDIETLVTFDLGTQKSQNLNFDGLLKFKVDKEWLKKIKQESCVMTPSSDAKFEEETTCFCKNDAKNLVNFHASTQKSQNWHFDGFL